jgi:PAS domain S-box-containing protein
MQRLDFQTIFDSSPNPHMVLDRDLRFVAANAAYLRAIALRREDVIGRPLFELFPHDPVVHAECRSGPLYLEADRGGARGHDRRAIHRKDGTIFTVRLPG